MRLNKNKRKTQTSSSKQQIKKNRDPIGENVDNCKWVKISGCVEKGLEGGSINSKRSIKTPKIKRINLTNKKKS
jgi:hypothetical protein